MLCEVLNLKVEPADPESYVGRFVSGLGLSEEVERRARELLRAGKEKNADVGKSPVGLAAAAVYATTLDIKEKITQADVSEVTDMSEVTIRNRYQELLEIDEQARTD